MTLIACLRKSNVPILLGDLLLSGTNPPANPVVFPTLGEHPTIPRSRGLRQPAGLVQKICVINDRLLVAWAGPQIVAKAVLKSMHKEFSDEKIDCHAINTFFRDFGTRYLRDSSFIGLFTDGYSLTSFGFGSFGFLHDELGECLVSGSGSGRLLEIINRDSQIELVEGKQRDVDQAISYMLTTATRFIGEELATGKLMDEHFGGGFEIATITTDGIEKLGDIMHLFWTWDRHKDKNPKLLPTIIKSDYVDKVLVIQRIQQKHNDSMSRWEIEDHTVNLVFPPTTSAKSMHRFRPQTPDLNCKFLCNYYIGTDGTGTGKVENTLYATSKKGEGPLRIDSTDQEFNFHFDLGHFSKEWNIVMSHLSQHFDDPSQ